MTKIKRTFYANKDSDFDSCCSEWLNKLNTKLFIEGKYTHIIDDDYTYDVDIITFADKSQGVLIGEIHNVQN